jgi:hypothetical protein
MSNSLRGQVMLKAGEKEYTLSFSINALVSLEDMLDESVNTVAAQLNDSTKVRMKTIRALVWAALRDNHSEVTTDGAGQIIDQAGIPATMAAIATAFTNAFPDAEAESSGSRPRKPARAGAG